MQSGKLFVFELRSDRIISRVHRLIRFSVLPNMTAPLFYIFGNSSVFKIIFHVVLVDFPHHAAGITDRNHT